MEPVTHVLTGVCLARAGLNRKAAYATLAMAISAELPDIDTLWGLRGPVVSFQHHRGITHTFLGIPFEAALVVAAVYALHRWRLRRPNSSGKPLTAAPMRWGWLYVFSLLALLSHLLLDFTNNYGIRPFFPFNPHWYAASIVFIFDPYIFAALLLAIVLPGIFRLVNSEIGVRKQPFRGRGMAIVALLVIASYWTARAWQHGKAMVLMGQQSLAVNPPAAPAPDDPNAPLPTPGPPTYVAPLRVQANPDPLSLFRWYGVADFGSSYQLATIDTQAGTVDPEQLTLPKTPEDAATRAAEASLIGRVYLDWSAMPLITEEHADGPGDPATLITFRDPRFLGNTPLLHLSTRSPLTATVALDAQNHVLEQTMDGKTQH